MWRIAMIVALLLTLVGVVNSPKAVSAQDGAVWAAAYYNNGFQIEPSALNTTSSTIAFSWGQGSPGNGVNADNFSARFGADPNFAGGWYRFFLLADDGVNVTLDLTNVIIRTYDSPKAGQLITADVNLTPGVHHIQIDYNERQGDAYLYFAWASLTNNPNPLPPFSGPLPATTVSLTSSWAAQYFNNPALSGNPAVTRSETTVGGNWNTGSPDAAIPADNFSARWISTQTLTGGNYQVRVRADDGFRVIINGTTYLNNFTSVAGQQFSVPVSLPAGQNTFVIEYYEAGGQAYLEFALSQQLTVPTAPSSPTQPTNPGTSGATAVINTGRLNVRSLPSNSGQILTRVSRGQVYPLLAQSGDGFWWQINANGTVGWVSARYVQAINANNVPVSNVTIPTVPTTGYNLLATARVNVRSSAAVADNIITVLPRNAQAAIVGRSSNGQWWQISYNGVVGWVSSSYTVPTSTVDFNRVPVTG